MQFIVAALVSAVASAALNIGLAWMVGPTRTATYGDKLTLPDVQTSNYGIPIATVRGQARITGNLIWMSDFIEESVTTSVSIDGGFLKPDSEVSNTTFIYRVSCAIGLCGHEIQNISRIWADDVLIYDDADVDGPSLTELKCTIYTGTQTQAVSPLMESIDGVGENPAYRGLAYVTFADFELSDYGNRIPNFSFEVEGI
jgi:hypothetical protein